MTKSASRHMRELRAKRKELGLCTQCGLSKPREGRVKCSWCARKTAEAMRELRTVEPEQPQLPGQEPAAG